MKVILASPRGFCAGVNMAVDSLDLALKYFGPPIYVYHEIVHNQFVVQSFRDKGAIFVDDLQQVPPGSNLMFSAHGVAPQVRKFAADRRLNAIDATCPLVTKVHLEAIKYAREGFTIVLIGHQGHDEVIGTMGEAPQAMVLVEDEEDVDRLQIPSDAKIAYLTQTTLSVDDANRIIRRLRQRFPQLVNPPKDDICYATQNRQEAVRILAQDVDVCLVVGSKNSSNSQRLRELAQETNTRAYLIDSVRDIRPEWLDDCSAVLVTAGASAPELLVQEVLQHLKDRYNASVEVRTTLREDVSFPLPRALRNLPQPVPMKETHGD